MTPARLAPDRTAVFPAPAVAMGDELPVEEPEVGVAPEPPPAPPVPAGLVALRVVTVPLDQTGETGDTVETGATVLVVLHEVEVVVLMGLVIVQGQSVMVRVVAWGGL